MMEHTPDAFGVEWEKEIMKLPKKIIVGMVKNQGNNLWKVKLQRDRLLLGLEKARDDIDTCRSSLQSPVNQDRVVRYRNYLVNQLNAMDRLIASTKEGNQCKPSMPAL